MKDLLHLLARHVTKIAAGWLIAHGAAIDSTTATGVGMVAAVLSFGWSYLHRPAPATPPRIAPAVSRLAALFLGGALFLGLTGCSLNGNVPHTTIKGRIGSSPFSITAPKDGDLSGFDLAVETNGTVHLHIEKLTVRMNPDVVSQTGDAQAKIITATGAAVTQAVQAAAAGAVAGASKGLTP